jgi:N-acetylmuramoyl-L-alanine amidase
VPYYTVKPGEHLAEIAKRNGFEDPQTIYDHPENSRLREKRPDPHLLRAGDRVFIPDKAPRSDSAPTAKVNPFSKKAPHVRLRVMLKDGQGNPLASTKGILTVGEIRIPVTTDKTGVFEEPLPVETKEASLAIQGLGRSWLLQIGALDPVKDGDGGVVPSGVKARLNNLGYNAGPVEGDFDDRAAAAIRAFQRDAFPKDKPTGEPDDRTLAELTRRHGC